ncbi:MAG: hypothetical protein ACLRPR_01110 [Eisenbergiella sp.]
MRKKLLASLMAAAMAATALAGCGGEKASEAPAEKATEAAKTESEAPAAEAEDNGEVVELEFWSWWSSEARKPHIEKMVQDFNDSQNKYHVTYVDIPWGDIFTRISRRSQLEIPATSWRTACRKYVSAHPKDRWKVWMITSRMM